MMEKKPVQIDRYANRIVAWRWPVIGLAALLLIFSFLQLKNLQFTSDYRVYFGPSNPQLLSYDAFEETYGSNDTLIIAIHSNSGDVFSKETLSVLETLTERAWKIPHSVRVDSLTNFQYMRAVGDDLTVSNLVEDAARLTPKDRDHIRRIALGEPVLVNRLLSPDGRTTGILITLMFPGKDHTEHLPQSVDATRKLVVEMQRAHPDLDIVFTGWPRLSQTLIDISIQELTRLAPFMAVLLVVTMFVMLRTWSGVLATLMVVLAPSLAAMTFASLVGIRLTPGTAIAPIVILTVAVADCVHIVLSMYDEMLGGMDKRRAVIESLRINTGPVFLTSLTTVIGFLSLNFSDSPPFQELGNITAFGVFVAWFLAMSLLPALLVVLPPQRPVRQSETVDLISHLGDYIVLRRKAVLWSTFVGTVAFIGLVPLNAIDDDFITWFDASIPARADTDFVQDNLTGTYQMEFSIDTGRAESVSDPTYLRDLDAFARWLRDRPETLHVYSLADTMKELNKALHGDAPEDYKLPERSDMGAQYLLLYELSLPYGLDLGTQINSDHTASRLTATLKNVTSGQIRNLKSEAEIWFAANALVAKASEATGVGVMFAFISLRTIRGMFVGTGLAFLLITGVILMALRNLKLGLISLPPNVLPVVVTFGIWGLAVGQIGMVASLVTAMTLGLVVDDTVHLVSAYHRARTRLGMSAHDSIRYTYAHVGRAVVATTVILVIGFAVVSRSVFQINEQLGVLTVMTIVVALALDLLFLPALIMAVDRDPICSCKSCRAQQVSGCRAT